MVKAKWPFVFKSEYFLKHFELLTNADLMKLFSSIGELQSTRVYNYLNDQNDSYNLSELQDLQSKPNVTWSYVMLVMIFKEDLKELIVCQDSLKTEKLPCTPCIVAIGPSIFHASKYVLIVDKDIPSLSVAMAMQFAAFFIFDICFPKKLMNTLKAFQRFILKFRYENSFIPKNKKKKISVNDQVLKFAADLAKYEAYLECDLSAIE
ncbi:hypothetical protein LOTGIDRAFT_175695 [Lottia gigantea]|uniref:Uncharacterized protein n=1 Tax=Lottia gigantea TaxID=225164 RepID=V4A6Y4_LOTGI|nr:hypothetical protein LOTGIDRAFT_175695 [Lottia gigantea]ESO92477.1 hypothetical protein LOTGIDRAFT_175695 [Lottia gigantea]